MNDRPNGFRRLPPLLLVFLTAGITPAAPAAGAEPDPQALQFFETKVRPVLVEHCYSCHSAQAKKLKAGLFVDSRAGLLKGGDTGEAITPGDPSKSLLVEAIEYKNVDLQMPPKTKLGDQQIADLTAWVKMGAPWPKEAAAVGTIEAFDLKQRKAKAWAFQPVQPQAPPAVKKSHWVRTPVDAFILAKLEAKNIAPAAAADPRTLIRRIYFDLIGLPPTSDEVEAFLKDAGITPLPLREGQGEGRAASAQQIPPAAIAALVDRLLASPHFGEKWARHWMDLVRYAETCGHEFEYPIPHAWRYRDYLIRAFNADVPYDQFVTEHIAGDLLANPRRNPSDATNESITATGFWFLHEATHAPVDVRLDGATRIDNQIDVFSKTFLGLTVACARCHDHKFDPIATKDYYALAGFLRSSRRQEALLDPHGKIESAVKQLALEKAKGDATLVGSVPKAEDKLIEEFAKYLLATAEVINGDAKSSSKTSRDDFVFDDFESGTYGNWTATGTAFGDKPQTQKTIGAYQGDVGAKGKWFINSHNIRPAETGGDVAKGDALIGTLTSKTFTIERDHITFLIGGGTHDKTCLQLIVEGKVVRTATGKNENRMSAGAIDVSELRGKKAQLRLVDDHTGGWGNIGLDHIVFTDRTGNDTAKTGRSADEVAKERGLDAGLLRRWVKAVQGEDIKQPSHPLYVWQRAVSAKATDAKALEALRTTISKESVAAKAQSAKEAESGVVFADFNGPTFGDWSATGSAFGSAPTQPRQWDTTAAQPRAIEPGLAHSGLISPKLRGVLRSPTFTINSNRIHYRLRGQGVQVRLIIDGYVMDVYNGLLFSDIAFNVDTKGKWQWRTQSGDLGKYLGHRAHIEFIDDGDGFVAIDEIRFGDAPGAAASAAPSPITAALLADAKITSLDSLARGYGQQMVDALAVWHTGKIDPAAELLVNTSIEHQLLWRDEPRRQEVERALASQAKRLNEIAATLPAPMKVPALTDGTGENEFVFIRGSHKNLGDEAPRQLLESIAGRQPAIPNGSGRLELAKRVVDPQNPFISRVIVNRLWHHLYGRGIVPTVDDFGFMGLPPSHPELLDWLAADFMKNGWSIKRTLRQMVLSSVYQQSSHVAPAPGNSAGQADPTNELLHRFPIRRLPAEAIRDAILTVSGRLDRTVGGPSVPVHLTPFMDGRGKPGSSGPLDGNGRRSVYTEIRRNFLPPMMLAFDYPNPFSTMGRRTVSNVPAQALILMNDPFVIEQAKRWATRVLDGKGTIDERITRMYEAALSRPPTEEELAALRGFTASQAKLYNAKEDDARVWADVAHVMFNMKAFVFVN